jgi:hypothetical protein
MRRIQKSKCAQLSQVAMLIIVIASAILIFLFVTKFSSSNKYEQVINTCRFSVLAQSATEVTPGVAGSKSPFDLHCDRRYINFYGTKVQIGLSPENMESKKVVYEGREVKKFTKMNEQVAYQVIAEELRICKFEFADGKVDIFPNNDNLVSGKHVCYVCSEITFDSETIDHTEYDNLKQYTMDTKYSGADATYYAYLTEKNIYDRSMWEQATLPDDNTESNLKIDTSKKYFVFIDKYTRGTITDLSKSNIWVTLKPVDEMNTYCDIQAN